MAWQTPKTNWQAADVVSKDDFNRIEGNIQHLQDTIGTGFGIAEAIFIESLYIQSNDLLQVADANKIVGKVFNYICGDAVDKNIQTLQALAASATAMNAVAASETAMNAIVASATARNAVAASATAMNAIAASETAMNAVVASATAMNAVAASATAMNAVAASATAMNAICKSAIAAQAICSPIQSRRSTLLTTLADGSKFSKTTVNVGNGGGAFDHGLNTNTIYIPTACYDDGDTHYDVYYGADTSKSVVSIAEHSGTVSVTSGVSLRGVRVVGHGGSLGYVTFDLYTAL